MKKYFKVLVAILAIAGTTNGLLGMQDRYSDEAREARFAEILRRANEQLMSQTKTFRSYEMGQRNELPVEKIQNGYGQMSDFSLHPDVATFTDITKVGEDGPYKAAKRTVASGSWKDGHYVGESSSVPLDDVPQYVLRDWYDKFEWLYNRERNKEESLK